jgi:2-dehydro-3-deoxyphosphogluconate aldolase/(4S)-4-hydroxy-2-oxoglutarate aldolase
MMPTGGVEPEEENLRKWFEAGVVCVGIGTNLIKAEYIKENKYSELTVKVKEVLDIIKKVKS